MPRSEPTGTVDDDIADRQAAQATAGRLQRALNHLNASEAALVCLVAFEGYSPSQAAGVLGISPATARTRLHRARRRLDSQLAAGAATPAAALLSLEDHPT